MTPRLSAHARLLREPRRFRFDAAVRVLTRAAGGADPAEAARFRGVAGLAYPAAEVVAVRAAEGGQPPQVAVGMMGLTGAAGVLPRFYTEVLADTLRNRSRAMADFLDLLSHRSVAMFAQAGTKYRLNRTAEIAAARRAGRRDPVSQALLALTGYGTPNLVERLASGADPLLHYAGFFATRPRSAERLAALVSDWLGRPVEVVQFAGAWLSLPQDQRTALPAGRQPGAWNALGVDAAIGVRAWDVQARIVLRVGPMDRAAFEALLPDRTGLRRLVSLVRAFLGYETAFAINPILAADEVPPLRLDAGADFGARLGWNSWIPAPSPDPHGPKRRDAADAVFEADIVESMDKDLTG